MRIIHQFLKQTKPEWVKEIDSKKGSFIVEATPVLEGGSKGAKYNLDIRHVREVISVRERTTGTVLPIYCPERHINGDGTFCLGYKSGTNINSEDKAMKWWEDLHEFLRCQHYAQKHGRWPEGKSLSHGNAAKQHLELIEITRNLGEEWVSELNSNIENQDGWLSKDLNMFTNKSKSISKPSLKCPRNCVKDKGNELWKKCSNRNVIVKISKLEMERRNREGEFWQSYKNMKCCGTMKKCKLRDE